jgi:CDP-diacylglycerol--serine O-phosphatidyltransferase
VDDAPPSRLLAALPQAVTLTGVFFGFLCLIWAPDHPYAAGVALVLAAVCDMVDGRVARMTGTASEFGAALDSLADVVSFGVAPAYLAYVWGLGGTAGDVDPGALLAFVFVVCGALRLARFNVQAAEGGSVDRFEGLPIPAGALYLGSFVMMVEEWKLDSLRHPALVAALLLFAAGLMVSKVPFQSFKKFKTRWGMALFYGNVALGLLELAVGLPGGTHMFLLLNVYVGLGLYRVTLGKKAAPAA